MEILNLFYHQYIFFGPLFVIVLALSKLISREKLTVNYFYSLSYLFMGLAMFQIVSYSTKAYPYYWCVSYCMIPVAITSPLLLYLRFRFLIQGKMMRIPAPVIIFLVAVPVIILAGPFVEGAENFVRNNIELRPLLDPSFMSLPLFYRCVHAINFLAKIILAAGLLLLIVRARFLWKRRNTAGTMLARISYIFTILMFSTAVMLIAGDLASFEFSKAAIAMVNTVTLGVFFASQYDPTYYAIFKHLKKRKKYESSKIRGIDIDAAIGRMNAIMLENDFYKEEEITLKKVAGLMNINPQQLSEILNSSLHTSFSTYVNDYKITEAKTLMMEHPDHQLTRIALMAGFNSTRTFNRAFMKREGLTPMDYRKRLAGKRRSGPGGDQAL